MKLSLPTVLSINAGYLDTAGFLTLHGLFTAHVTGNFVTLGAALVNGSTGAVTKLLALPVFCLFVMLVRLLDLGMASPPRGRLLALLVIKLLLLTAGSIACIAWGPFADADAWRPMLAGLLLVAGMAVQNALHRLHMGTAPPTTLMTGSTTQVMLDVVDLAKGSGDAAAQAATKARVLRLLGAVLAFAIGCAVAAIGVLLVGQWTFALVPFLALAALLAAWRAPAA